MKGDDIVTGRLGRDGQTLQDTLKALASLSREMALLVDRISATDNVAQHFRRLIAEQEEHLREVTRISAHHWALLTALSQMESEVGA